MGDGIEDAGEGGGAGGGEAGGGGHHVEVAVGGDGEWGRCGFRGGVGDEVVHCGVDAVFGGRNGIFKGGFGAEVGVFGFGDVLCGDGGDGGGGFHGDDFFLLFGLLGEAELVFHLDAELGGGSAEFSHELADVACEFGQLLRSEEEQGDKEDDG